MDSKETKIFQFFLFGTTWKILSSFLSFDWYRNEKGKFSPMVPKINGVSHFDLWTICLFTLLLKLQYSHHSWSFDVFVVRIIIELTCVMERQTWYFYYSLLCMCDANFYYSFLCMCDACGLFWWLIKAILVKGWLRGSIKTEWCKWHCD